MDRVRELGRRLWYLLNRRRLEAALRAEMEAHRAEMPRPAWFGNTLRLREEASDVWGWRWLDDLARDARLSLRSLRRSPGFTVVATLILSLGIGVNLVFFQIAHVTLLQPPAVKDPQTLAAFHRQSRTFYSNGVPYPMAMFVRDHSAVLSAVLVSRDVTLAWGENGEHRVTGTFVSSNWFEELGAPAAAGRLFRTDTDANPTASPVVVLSHAFWQRHFGGRSDVVGRTIRINNRPVVIAGVVDRRFPSLQGETGEIWLPVEHAVFFQPGNPMLTNWAAHSMTMYGRLRAGVSMDAAKAGLQGTLTALASLEPKYVTAGEWLEPHPATDRFMDSRERQEVRTVLTAVSALALVVLLVACLNLSNLVFARATAQVRELSIRTALGAGRWRIVRLLLVESAVFAGAGALGAVLIAGAAVPLLRRVLDLPAAIETAPGWATMAAALAAAAIATVVVGLAPAWKIGRRDLTLAARDGGERATRTLHAARLRHWLIAGQVAGSCVLLVFAGQMAGSLQRLLAVDQDFGIDAIAVVEPSLTEFGITPQALLAYWDDLQARISGHPDVEHSALASSWIFSLGGSSTTYAVVDDVQFRTLAVGPGFFGTIRLPLLAGREFTRTDDGDSAVIISRRGALAMYGTVDVLGQGFPKGESAPVVVGIAADARLSSIRDADAVELYSPLQAEDANVMFVRVRNDATALLPHLRAAARTSDARVVADARLVRDDFDRSLAAPRRAAALAWATSVLALGLASIGLFGVVSYGAGLRLKEVGIRLALGAGRRSIVGLLVRPTFWTSAAGMLTGLAAGFPLGRALAGSPFYLDPLDAWAYGLATATFLGAGAVAALLPAWRLLRGNPLHALRHE